LHDRGARVGARPRPFGPAQHGLADRFSSRFWATLTAALPDGRAVSALGKRAGLVCRTSDGPGSVTVGP